MLTRGKIQFFRHQLVEFVYLYFVCLKEHSTFIENVLAGGFKQSTCLSNRTLWIGLQSTKSDFPRTMNSLLVKFF